MVEARVLDALALIQTGANTFSHSHDDVSGVHHLSVDRLPAELNGMKLALFAEKCGRITHMELRASDEFEDHLKMLLHFSDSAPEPAPPARVPFARLRRIELELDGYGLDKAETAVVRTLVEKFYRTLGVEQTRMSYALAKDAGIVTVHILDLDFVDYIKLAHIMLGAQHVLAYSIALDVPEAAGPRRLSVELQLALPQKSRKRPRDSDSDDDELEPEDGPSKRRQHAAPPPDIL